MTTYAGVKDGFVRELFTPLPDWSHIPVDQLFAPGYVDEWVPVDGLDQRPASNWRYADGTFAPPTEDDLAVLYRVASR